MTSEWKTKEILSMANRSAAGESNPVNLPPYDHASLVIGLDSVTGGLNIDLLESFDGTHWYSILGTLAGYPIDSVGNGAETFAIDHPLAPYYKLLYSFENPGDDADFDANLYGIDVEENG